MSKELKNDFISIKKCIQKCAISIHKTLQNQNNQDAEYLNSTNSSGDTQLAVDVACDKLIEKNLLELECVGGVCSEEKQEAVYKNNASNKILVAYDPLDGSSLFDSNLSVGSIFGIYEKEFASHKIISACYVVYGPRLELVWADDTSDKVKHFLYDFDNEKWLEKPALKLGEKGKLNAPGGTQKYWSARHKKLVDSLFAQGYRLRYSGGMVPDLHQILIKGGGLFSYPATQDAQKGKLRKLFEVFPFAFIYEKAGGEAIDGTTRLLSLECENLHDTTQCFLGSKNEISSVKEAYNDDN